MQGIGGSSSSGISGSFSPTQVYNSNGNVYSVSEAGITAAILNLPGADHRGYVHIPDGTFSIGTGLTLGKKTKLYGEGPNSSILQLSSAVPCVTIDPTNTPADWQLQDLQIDVNSKAADGVYTTFAGQSGQSGQPIIRNIKVTNVPSTNTGINLTDPYRMLIEVVNISTSGGTGIKLLNDTQQTTDFGNSLFQQIIVNHNANGGVGFDLESTDQTRTLNLMTWLRCDSINDVSTRTGITGIKLRGVKNSRFISMNLEHKDIGIDFGPTGTMESDQNDFDNIRIYNAKTNGVKFNDGSYYNHFQDGTILGTSSGITIVNDLNNLATKPNWFDNIQWSAADTIHTAGAKSFMASNEAQTTGAAKGASTPTGPTVEGRTLTCICTDGNAAFHYISGAWHYASLT